MADEKKKKPKKKCPVRCYDCKYAVLQKWDKNPTVAYCNKTGNKDVAHSARMCDKYRENPEEPYVMRLTHIR